VTSGLFVYGTLAPGRRNEHVLADVLGRWEPAHVRGRLVELGWGSALGFPAIELDVEGDVVEGLLFTCAVLDEHWVRLDEFEGDGYERVVTEAVLGTGGYGRRLRLRAPS
jgi:gamma-glutamylcyclotransferase (GGCT)/AIG2-like uncharacterized protein YtfP